MVIISNALDNSSSGKVVENLVIEALNKKIAPKLIFERIFTNSKEITELNKFDIRKINFLSRIEKVFLILFKISIVDFCNALKAFRWIKKNVTNNENIIILVTGVNFFTIHLLQVILLRNFHTKLELNVRIHFLDPIYAKNAWGENKFLRIAKYETLKMCLKLAEKNNVKISTTNDKFSKFFFETFKLDKLPESIISYCGSQGIYMGLKHVFTNKLSVYYRGSINELRNEDFLLNVFNKISISSRFEFIIQGNKTRSQFLYPNLIFLPFSNNPAPERINLFLDIDLKFNDVFISGKLFEYLGTNLPILVISPLGSAVRDFISNQVPNNKNIFIVDFNEEEIKKALEFIYNNINNLTFDREIVMNCLEKVIV
jgi:hypothetical protein